MLLIGQVLANQRDIKTPGLVEDPGVIEGVVGQVEAFFEGLSLTHILSTGANGETAPQLVLAPNRGSVTRRTFLGFPFVLGDFILADLGVVVGVVGND